MMYFRGNDRDYDDWGRLGCPAWNWNEALRFFKKSEANQNRKLVAYKNGKYHSANGPLIIDSTGPPHPFENVVLSAAREFGYSFVEEVNADHYLGYTRAQGTFHNGRRTGVAKSFLTPASKRSNMHVIKHALVHKIDIVNQTATSVRFTINGSRELIAKSRKEIILSAGALSSPQLLMLSGIGPRDHLEKYGIPVLADLPVGKGLQDHVGFMLFFQVEPCEDDRDPNLESLDSIYELAMRNRGPFVRPNLRNLNAFINTQRRSKYPDIQLQHYYFRRGTNDIQPYISGMKDPAHATLLRQIEMTDVLGIAVSLMRPKSRGCVTLSGATIDDKPNIDLNFLDYEEEVDTLVRAIKLLSAFDRTFAFKAYRVKRIRLPIPGCDHLSTDEYYRCYVHNFAKSNNHQTSTSRMGPGSDPDSVVDCHLRVIGVNGLRQIDAGIMPFVPSGNTNAPTIMVAEKGADLVKQDWNWRQ